MLVKGKKENKVDRFRLISNQISKLIKANLNEKRQEQSRRESKRCILGGTKFTLR